MFKEEELTDYTTTSSRAASESPPDTASGAESPNSDAASWLDIDADVSYTLLTHLKQQARVKQLKREIEERDIAIEIYFAEIDKLTTERIRKHRAMKEIERTTENDTEILQSFD